ncbi:uncharacterized protein LOC144196672 isoform X2 [Stigmatopora nigra]
MITVFMDLTGTRISTFYHCLFLQHVFMSWSKKTLECSRITSVNLLGLSLRPESTPPKSLLMYFYRYRLCLFGLQTVLLTRSPVFQHIPWNTSADGWRPIREQDCMACHENQRDITESVKLKGKYWK